MEVSDNRVFDLRKAFTNDRFMPEEGQRGRVVTEEHYSLAGPESRKGAAYFRQMVGPQSLPLGKFGGQRFRMEHRQCDQG